MDTKYVEIDNTNQPRIITYLRDNNVEIKNRNNTFRLRSNPDGLRGKIKAIECDKMIEVSSNNPKTTHREKIKVYFEKRMLESEEEMEPLMNMMFSEEGFTRHNTFIKIPYHKEGEELKLFGDMHAFYNFRLRTYESISSVLDENALPMFLKGIYFKKYPERATMLYTYDGVFEDLLNTNMCTSFGSTVNKNHKLFTHHEQYDYSTNYFHNFATLSQEQVNFSEGYGQINKIFVNFDFDNSISSHLLDVPFYTSIDLPFSGMSMNNFRKIFDDSQMADVLMNIVGNSTQAEFVPLEVDRAGTLYRAMDVVDLLVNLEAEQVFEMATSPENVQLIDIDNSILRYENPQMILDMTKLVLVGKMRNMMKEHTTNFMETLVNNQPRYSELLCYRVEKHKDAGINPMQTYYFYNYGNAKTFIDTQVQFGSLYTYTLSAFYFVSGLTCNLDFEPSSINYQDFTAMASLTVEPSFKIVEVPDLLEKTIRVTEPPPLPPKVKFLNAGNVNNKITISLQDSHGILSNDKDRREMVAFDEQDYEYIRVLKDYVGSYNFYFSHIASDKKYQIYKIDYKPTSINDFAGQIHYLLQSSKTDSFGNPVYNALEFTDYIPHNQKVYYLFRTLTHYDNPSNPTVIYSVEKIKDADETFLNVEEVVIEEEIDYEMETSFRRFMTFGINEEHLLVSPLVYESATTAKNANLSMGEMFNHGDEGTKADSVWEYKDLKSSYIKLRLESKNTGKKIDLNLVFGYKNPKNNN